jgi:hypothetical protein
VFAASATPDLMSPADSRQAPQHAPAATLNFTATLTHPATPTVLNNRHFLSWVGTFSPQATDGRELVELAENSDQSNNPVVKRCDVLDHYLIKTAAKQVYFETE